MDEVFWVVSITHRHGTDMSICRSEDGAQAAVADWTRQWWADEMGDVAEPVDDQEAVNLYFGTVSDEFYDITQAAVKP